MITLDGLKKDFDLYNKKQIFLDGEILMFNNGLDIKEYENLKQEFLNSVSLKSFEG